MQHPFLLRQVSPTRNKPNTSPNAPRNKQNWSHWHVAILCKSVLLAPGTPSRHPKIRFLYSLPLRVRGGSANRMPLTARTECRPGHSGDSALRSRSVFERESQNRSILMHNEKGENASAKCTHVHGVRTPASLTKLGAKLCGFNLAKYGKMC